jgi:hypothetical protein
MLLQSKGRIVLHTSGEEMRIRLEYSVLEGHIDLPYDDGLLVFTEETFPQVRPQKKKKLI